MEGGITINQLNTLYELFQKRDYENKRWEALLKGINLDKELKKQDERDKYMFKDPKEYEELSPEERERKTNEMLGKHRSTLNME